jgi:2-C-methyl-D-erythritol 2,4-cyclodiphosphate synthase
MSGEPGPGGSARGVRVGHGWDVHRLVAGRPLVLGGVDVPSERGEDGFSDGDVLLHAVIDALLGACALGDIGAHFPPGREEWRGVSSRVLLARTRGLLAAAGFRPVNVDCTVALEQPRILPYVPHIRRTIAEDLDLTLEAVSVKGKTGEGLGPVGEGSAVEAWAVALVEEMPR